MFDNTLFIPAPFHPEGEYLTYLSQSGNALVPARASKSLRPVPQRMTVFKEFVPGATEHDAYALYHTLKDIDLRIEPLYVRQRLLQGARHHLYINGQHIITIPHKLLQAAARFGIFNVSPSMVELPLDTDAGGVKILVRHLLDIANRTDRPQRLRDTMTLYDSLAVCQAARTLGLTRYTNHIFHTLAIYLSTCIPSYEDMDAVLRFSATHWRLWQEMVCNLSAAVRGDEIADVEGFARFCFARPVLYEAIVETMRVQEAQQEQARLWAEEKERRAVEKEEQRKMWLVDLKLERSQRDKQAERRKHAGEQRADKKKRTARVTAMRQVCLAKTRASGKDRVMSAEEKKWYVKEFGKQPPRGC